MNESRRFTFSNKEWRLAFYDALIAKAHAARAKAADEKALWTHTTNERNVYADIGATDTEVAVRAIANAGVSGNAVVTALTVEGKGKQVIVEADVERVPASGYPGWFLVGPELTFTMSRDVTFT